ncbi:MAG: GNAT family N-acetyltransferase [Armatimonadota bacterium]
MEPANINIANIKIETERLILRTLRELDAPELFPLINDADVARYMLRVPHPYPENALPEWLKKAEESMERKEQFEFAIILKETGKPIGVCSLDEISWEYEKAELGYWLGKPYWRRGIMTEAAKAVVSFGFDTLKLERIYACCFEQNQTSAKVIQKAGLRYEGCSRHDIKRNGVFINILCFGMIRADYSSE